MPRLDGTGPWGRGPMTGWGRGFCGMGSGRGFGRGLGRLFGWGRSITKKDLEDYKKALQEELKDVDEELQNTK